MEQLIGYVLKDLGRKEPTMRNESFMVGMQQGKSRHCCCGVLLEGE